MIEREDTGRAVGKLEGRMDSFDKRLERIEAQMDELLNIVHSARGGWRMLILVSGVSAALGAGALNLLHYLARP